MLANIYRDYQSQEKTLSKSKSFLDETIESLTNNLILSFNLYYLFIKELRSKSKEINQFELKKHLFSNCLSKIVEKLKISENKNSILNNNTDIITNEQDILSLINIIIKNPDFFVNFFSLFNYIIYDVSLYYNFKIKN